MIKITKKLIISVILISAPISAFAISSPANLNLVVSPQFPKAGEVFTVRAESYSFDALRADFIWAANGKTVASGKGITEETFTAGKLGSSLKITVTATSFEGFTYSISQTISQNDVDLVIQPTTYTPPFYRGAALVSPGSEVDIIAVPHLFSSGAKLGAKSLIYEWNADGAPLKADSGQGKSKLALDLPRGNGEHEVTLQVSSSGGGVTYKKSAKIKVYAPEIIFYETSQLTGPKPTAVSVFNGRASATFSIIAEPYFFNIPSLSSAKLSWTANGQVIDQQGAANPRLLELNAPAGAASQTNFTFIIDDLKTTLQKLQASFMVNIQ